MSGIFFYGGRKMIGNSDMKKPNIYFFFLKKKKTSLYFEIEKFVGYMLLISKSIIKNYYLALIIFLQSILLILIHL